MNLTSTPLLIEARSVDLGYGKKKILSGISFSIYAGDFVGIVGPNGSGKTTLLRAILGILRPLRGEIVLGGGNNGPFRVGYVPQRDSIDQMMPFTVHDVVMMGRFGKLGAVKLPSEEDRKKVRLALNHVDIEDIMDISFKELSGGQKQRTLIARALASEPDVLILDEPTNGMDLASRSAIMELIRRLHSLDGLTVIMVSHLLSDVATSVKKLILVEQGLFQVGTVDEILTEENLSKLYNVPVSIGDFLGNKIILAGPRNV
ncbi:MAG: metal ABC transporter ATP-binding protein [Bacteroidota bacterium]